MTGIEDIGDLIGRVALRERAAFDALYSRTSAKLFGVALRVLQNRAEAEEALQEAYVKIWRNADRYAQNGLSPMTWLITIARNQAIDRLRARKAPSAGLEKAEEVRDSGPTPEQAAVASSERARIDACLDELEPDKALAVRCAYLDGDTYQDLAERLNVPLNTIRTWLRRSLLKLRECMTR